MPQTSVETLKILIIDAHLAITFVSPRVDLAVSDSPFDAAVFFVGVRAIGEATKINEGTDLAKVPGNLFGDHIP